MSEMDVRFPVNLPCLTWLVPRNRKMITLPLDTQCDRSPRSKVVIKWSQITAEQSILTFLEDDTVPICIAQLKAQERGLILPEKKTCALEKSRWTQRDHCLYGKVATDGLK